MEGGSYVLLMWSGVETEVEVGRLGRFLFPAGHYAYCGSALNGLEARLARHARRVKKCHWHVDYLLPRLELVDAWTLVSDKRLECLFGRILRELPGAAVPVRGFGSSDCRCPAHLVHFTCKPSFGVFADALDRSCGLSPSRTWNGVGRGRI